jgi:hypothetical protein
MKVSPCLSSQKCSQMPYEMVAWSIFANGPMCFALLY